MAKKSGENRGLVQAGVRLPQKTLDELDAMASKINAEAGWEKVTRSDLMRNLILDGLGKMVGPSVRATKERRR